MRASDLDLTRAWPARWPIQLACVLMAASACLSLPAHAEGKKDPQEQAMRRLRLQLQQLQQEQATGQEQLQRALQDKATAEAALKQADAERSELKTGVAAATRQASSKARELDQAQQSRDALQRQLTDAQTQLTQARESLRQAQAHGTEQDRALAAATTRTQQQGQEIANCAAHNVALYHLGIELLSRYENKGVAEVLSSQESFLQTQRVALENLVQDYRDKLDKARVGAALSPAPNP